MLDGLFDGYCVFFFFCEYIVLFVLDGLLMFWFLDLLVLLLLYIFELIDLLDGFCLMCCLCLSGVLRDELILFFDFVDEFWLFVGDFEYEVEVECFVIFCWFDFENFILL